MGNDRMLQFVDAYLDGSIADSDAAALEAWLESDAAHAMLFSEHALLNRHLSERTGRAAASAAPVASIPVQPRLSTAFPVALAAAILLAGAAVAIYAVALHGRAVVDPPAPQGPTVATLIDMAGGTTVIVDNDLANPGQEYRAGVYQIASGSADLQLTSGAGLQMRGRTQMRLIGDMRCDLAQGTVRFDCPVSAHGYTVDLPDGSRIVDLGTRFVVHVDEAGRSYVRVISGSVEFDRIENGPVVLKTGQAGIIADHRFTPISATAATPSPIETTLSEPSEKHTFPVAADDLLQTHAGAAELTRGAAEDGVFGGQTVESLTNGPAVWHAQPRQTYESWSTEDGGAVTWQFDADRSPLGVDIDRIDVIAGCWPNRIGHKYAIEVLTIGGDDFEPLHDVIHPDDKTNSAGEFETHLRIARTGDDPLAVSVTAIRFTFYDDATHGANLGQSVYREIDVIGRPVEIGVTASETEEIQIAPSENR